MLPNSILIFFLMFQTEYQTPSPADSAVHDLGNEDLRRSKGDGIYARISPEDVTNSSVVAGEKGDKKIVRKDVQKVRGLYESQLKNLQQNAMKVESSLVNQIHQVRMGVTQETVPLLL